LVRKGSRVGPLSDSVALPPVATTKTLTLKLFRRERAISTFDDTFNPPHRSSPSFSTLVSSDLQAVLPALHPAHGSITWFRVYRRQLNAHFGLAFASAPPQNGLTLLTTVSRRIIMQKARRQAFPLRGMALRPLVGMWFQVHVPPLIGVLLIFRSRYLVRYRSPEST
jgi:hypothetical protein